MASVAFAPFSQKVAPPPDFSLEFGRIRDTTLALCSSLEIEDCVVQSMPDASPVKWHLAHTTWFFEQFVLATAQDDYRVFEPSYEHLFNSYYQTVGPQFERKLRGVLSRPTVAEIIRYRRYVDEAVQNLLAHRKNDEQLRALITLGLNHEQQHQELLLTDVKHAFSCNPSFPRYRSQSHAITAVPEESPHLEMRFIDIEGGLKRVGADATGFAFDNERPAHRVLIEPFALANRLVTNGEYLEFIRAGGYRSPQLWLSDGWDFVNEGKLNRPLYWQESLDSEFTLHGLSDLQLNAPVCHLSFFEADAYARWAGKRLPTESEWELVAQDEPVFGNLLGSELLHPVAATTSRGPIKQLFGDVWEWTASSYLAYPGYRTPEGAIGEYNGKFMSGRMVLRGGSCVTPDDHIRATYRNFFDPKARWQFAGVRLAH